MAEAAGLAQARAGGDDGSIPIADEITALVAEVAERSQELKEAWSEFHSENGEGPGTKAPGLAPTNAERGADVPPPPPVSP
jgi:hypothetical protein